MNDEWILFRDEAHFFSFNDEKYVAFQGEPEDYPCFGAYYYEYRSNGPDCRIWTFIDQADLRLLNTEMNEALEAEQDGQ